MGGVTRVDSEPPNVSIILDGAVRLRSASNALIEALRAKGYQPRRTPEGSVIAFERSTPEDGDLRNPDLVALLRVLSSAGVAFLRDHKQMWSPADVVAQLIEAGADFTEPRATAFDGSVWWVWDHPWSGQ
jgi:hypothetical protein